MLSAQDQHVDRQIAYENPLSEAFSNAESNYFQVTSDAIDAASRALNPIFIREIESEFPYGKCFKDR